MSTTSFHKVRVQEPSPPSEVTLPRRVNQSSKSKRRIYVDESRKDIDEYMLRHIRRQRKSMKQLIK